MLIIYLEFYGEAYSLIYFSHVSKIIAGVEVDWQT